MSAFVTKLRALIKALKAVFRKDFAKVVRSFDKVVADLTILENRARADALSAYATIVSLEAGAKANLVEADKAKGVRAKIAALLD